VNAGLKPGRAKAVKACKVGAVLLIFALPCRPHEKKVAQSYDLHGTVIEMATSPFYAGWVTLYLPKYTIKSADRTYKALGGRHCKALQVGQKIDFRIEGGSIFIRAEGAKEMRCGLAEVSLNGESPPKPAEK
jgi:hypothetical protein